MAPPRPRSPFLLTLAAVVAVGLATLAGCSTTSGGTPVTLSTTTTVPAGAGPTTSTTAEPSASVGKELYVYAPVEGDCIDLRATGDDGPATTRSQPDANATPRGSNELILRLDCALPHQYEVIAVVPAGLPDDPGDEALIAAAKLLCPPAFATYVGTPYQSSELEVGWILPSVEQRGARCPGHRLPGLRPRRQAHRARARLGPLSAQRPSNRGDRFSAKAARPSARSALAHARVNTSV